MSQTVILSQFIKYLDINSNNYLTELKAQKNLFTQQQLDKVISEHTSYIEKLKQDLDGGYCFGFSLCHAGMNITGKLAWWEHAQVKMHNWDGKENSLDNEFILPNSTEGKPTSLRKLFERGI